MSVASELIAKVQSSGRNDLVFKAWALPRFSETDELIARNFTPKEISEAEAAFQKIEANTNTLEDHLVTFFSGDPNRAPPFRAGRFNENGLLPVFYTAIDEQTCRAEISFHLGNFLKPGDPPKTYCLCSFTFSGVAFDLVGHENEFAQLTSQDKSGYPFCTEVAIALRGTSSALYSRSARKVDGTCVPTFELQAITQGLQLRWFQIYKNIAGQLMLEDIP